MLVVDEKKEKKLRDFAPVKSALNLFRNGRFRTGRYTHTLAAQTHKATVGLLQVQQVWVNVLHAGSLYLFRMSVYVGRWTFQAGFKAFKWSIGGGSHRAHYSATAYPWEREIDIYSRERWSVYRYFVCKISKFAFI